jgi:hypothetical protein
MPPPITTKSNESKSTPGSFFLIMSHVLAKNQILKIKMQNDKLKMKKQEPGIKSFKCRSFFDCHLRRFFILIFTLSFYIFHFDF